MAFNLGTKANKDRNFANKFFDTYTYILSKVDDIHADLFFLQFLGQLYQLMEKKYMTFQSTLYLRMESQLKSTSSVRSTMTLNSSNKLRIKQKGFHNRTQKITVSTSASSDDLRFSQAFLKSASHFFRPYSLKHFYQEQMINYFIRNSISK